MSVKGRRKERTESLKGGVGGRGNGKVCGLNARDLKERGLLAQVIFSNKRDPEVLEKQVRSEGCRK
jgi:hypothetical protein